MQYVIFFQWFCNYSIVPVTLSHCIFTFYSFWGKFVHSYYILLVSVVFVSSEFYSVIASWYFLVKGLWWNIKLVYTWYIHYKLSWTSFILQYNFLFHFVHCIPDRNKLHTIGTVFYPYQESSFSSEFYCIFISCYCILVDYIHILIFVRTAWNQYSILIVNYPVLVPYCVIHSIPF